MPTRQHCTRLPRSGHVVVGAWALAVWGEPDCSEAGGLQDEDRLPVCISHLPRPISLELGELQGANPELPRADGMDVWCRSGMCCTCGYGGIGRDGMNFLPVRRGAGWGTI